MVYPKVKSGVDVPMGTPNGTLFVSVDGTWENPKLPGVTLEDCARGYWTRANLAAAKADRCEWLMARKKGKIVGVWKINTKKGWMDPWVTPKKSWPSDMPKDRPRGGCELIPVGEEMWKKFVGERVHLGRAHNTLRGCFK